MRRVIPALAIIIAVMLITSSLLPTESIIRADSMSINPPAGPVTLEERLMASVKKDKICGMYNNHRILGPIKAVWNYKAFVLAYDGRSGEHYVNYVLFTDKDGEITLFGGGGGAANDRGVPVSFSGGGGESTTLGSYWVTYGEVFDPRVAKVEVFYPDGESVVEEVTNGGYLTVKYGVRGATGLRVYNDKSEVMFKILPETFAHSAGKLRFTELYPSSLAEISRLYILDGRTGHNFTTEDEQRIDRFLQLMNSLTFKKKLNQTPRTGYLYFVDLFQGDTKVLRITFAGDVQIDGTYYSVDRDIGEDLDSFYEALR
ncbi:hypothetical protein JCM15765_32800 [Paradesulfitobacterium aromaticivorans]